MPQEYRQTHTMYEVEVKFRIDDLAAVEAKLAALGCVPGSACEERDQFFQHPARNFVETDECLRMRRRILADGRQEASVTYKGPKLDSETKTRREMELPVEPSALASWTELFNTLGFRAAATVRKFRRYGELRGDNETVTVLLDFLPELGQHYIELEIVAEENACWQARRQWILDLAQRLELGESVRSSYLKLLQTRGH